MAFYSLPYLYTRGKAMKILKLLHLLVISVLIVSCGKETTKIIKITPQNMSRDIVHTEESKEYSYYKKDQSHDMLTLKAVCLTSNMNIDKNSNIAWQVEYKNKLLPLPVYTEKGDPMFVQNNNALTVFLSNVNNLGQYTVKAYSDNGRCEYANISVLSPYKLSSSIVVDSNDLKHKITVGDNTTLVRGKTYSFRLTNPVSFGNVTWSVYGGNKNDALISSNSFTDNNIARVGLSNINTYGDEAVFLSLSDEQTASHVFLTASTPYESHTITINAIPPKTDLSLPCPTFAPFPIINGYEIRVYMPSDVKNEQHILEISENNSSVWNEVETNENGYYAKIITREESFNVDETIIIKARIKDTKTESIGKTSSIELLLESFPGTVKFSTLPAPLLLPNAELSDEEWENYSSELFTLNISSSFDDIKNIAHKDTLLASSQFEIYKKQSPNAEKEVVLSRAILNDDNELVDYNVRLPMYNENDKCIYYGHSKLVKGFAPRAIVEGMDTFDVNNITDIYSDINIVPYVFSFDKQNAYYRIAIPLNTAILPQENSWVLAMHYRNTQENKEEFAVLRGVDFKNENGFLVHMLSDKNGNPINLKTNSPDEQIRLMLLPSSRIVGDVYYAPYTQHFDNSIWWNSTLNSEYMEQHVIIKTNDEVQRYTNKRIAQIALIDPSVKAEYAIDKNNTSSLELLSWHPVDFPSSNNAEISLFEKEQAEGTLYVRVTSLNTKKFYIIAESVSLIPCRDVCLKDYKSISKNDPYGKHAYKSIQVNLESLHPYMECEYVYTFSSSHSDNGGGGGSSHYTTKWKKYEKGLYPLELYKYQYDDNGHTASSYGYDKTFYILLRDTGYLDNTLYFSSDAVIKKTPFTNGIKLPEYVSYKNDIIDISDEKL